MNFIRTMFCVMGVCAASTSVMAVESTDLSVVGAITPGGCIPTFTNNGELDYGDIDPGLISATGYSRLASKQLNFSINCSAPTKVAVKPQSQRGQDSIAGATKPSSGNFSAVPLGIAGGDLGLTYAAGLNFDESGNKIGGVAVNIRAGNSTVDGNRNIDMLEKDGDRPFQVKPSTRTLRGSTYAWAVKGDVEPMAFTNLSSTVNIQAYLNTKNELDLSQEITLDGLITFELEYL
ncbi:DUF1120 domain-containing protein [Acinetobacter courvalinii]|nr:DUF1120 domain-containing protein [Acinetobacter courvalinii]